VLTAPKLDASPVPQVWDRRPSLKNEGRADRASGKMKDALDDVKDAAEDAIDKVKDKLHRD
jgi:hypothetical protein